MGALLIILLPLPQLQEKHQAAEFQSLKRIGTLCQIIMELLSSGNYILKERETS